MMISAQHIGKKYVLGGSSARTNSLRESLMTAARRPLARMARRRESEQEFWALDDITFDVAHGEVLGIIGRNGAGKSTLLKVLSRVTEPTRGRIELRGRIASLLEVGTGFHPELTGRENVYLNGTILGMRKREIDSKFDAIVEFADVERFIDTPVKRYSSGMYVRLAFAVAAHLEPEILVVDEVLAVGDAEFQRKCLGKMGDVAREGRTVLFVSHNMAAIAHLCTRGLFLERGRVGLDGSPLDAITRYLTRGATSGHSHEDWNYRNRSERVRVSDVTLLSEGVPTAAVTSGQRFTIRVAYETLAPELVGTEMSVSIVLRTDSGRLVNLWTNLIDKRGSALAERGYFDCVVNRWPFRGMPIRADVFTHTGPDVHEWIEDCLVFDSHDGDFYGTGVVTNPDQGIMFIDHTWTANAT